MSYPKNECGQAHPDSLVAKAKRYSLLKYSLTIIETIYLLGLLFLFQGSGLCKVLSDKISQIITPSWFLIPAYIFIIYFVYYLLNFPLNIYQTFILERKFCLSNQRISDWFMDQIKIGTIFYIIAVILIGALYYILKHYMHTWWLVVSLFWIFFSLILTKLAPVIIIPLFFKYEKLSDSALRERIISLANKMQVKILDVFQINFSKKSLKANAAFAGWGSTKRVILADTLKDKYSYDEIEVILAHEFAHYKLKHAFKLILLNSLAITVSFYLIFKTSVYALRIFGLTSLSDIASLPIIIIYFMLLGIFMQPFENYLSRGFEKNADITALRITGLKEAFISMMEKLSLQNLADKNPHPLIKFFFFDHPPVDERIALAKSS